MTRVQIGDECLCVHVAFIWSGRSVYYWCQFFGKKSAAAGRQRLKRVLCTTFSNKLYCHGRRSNLLLSDTQTYPLWFFQSKRSVNGECVWQDRGPLLLIPSFLWFCGLERKTCFYRILYILIPLRRSYWTNFSDLWTDNEQLVK